MQSYSDELNHFATTYQPSLAPQGERLSHDELRALIRQQLRAEPVVAVETATGLIGKVVAQATAFIAQMPESALRR